MDSQNNEVVPCPACGFQSAWESAGMDFFWAKRPRKKCCLYGPICQCPAVLLDAVDLTYNRFFYIISISNKIYCSTAGPVVAVPVMAINVFASRFGAIFRVFTPAVHTVARGSS